MKLVEKNIQEFIEILASKEPAPGGGSASALCGAVGTSLLTMVANLTHGKEKFKDEEPLMKSILTDADLIIKEFLYLVDQDTEAFQKVSAVFSMPKDSDEEKTKRREAMQNALKYASIVPLNMMVKAVEALKLLDKAVGHSNPSAISDLGVGAIALKTALQGAWLNVKINLSSIKDGEYVNDMAKKGEKLLNDGNMIADKVYETVLESLT